MSDPSDTPELQPLSAAQRRALDVLLAEELGASAPPADLSASILRRAALRRDSSRTPADTSIHHDSVSIDDPHAMTEHPSQDSTAFASVADAAEQRGFVREFCAFMRDNSKWWLLPFLFVFSLFGLAVILGSTGAAPFIYTLF